MKSILNDIKKTENPVVDENDEYYIVNANVKYPNNANLVSEKIYFDKKYNLKEVQVLNKDGNALIRMKFDSIEYSKKFDNNLFDLDTLVKDTECTDESCKNTESTEETSILDDIVYPLYLPADTYLSS